MSANPDRDLDDHDAPDNMRDEPLRKRLLSVFKGTWDLGITSFGGPAVHFQIFHRRFVQQEKYRWIDEQTYKELFAVSQALPGPASTKLAFCITLTHAGSLPALMQFVLWALPGALGMFVVALAVSHIPDTLPVIVYAFLSGLNAATVGVIAVSSLMLSTRVISDRLTRAIVALSACAAVSYSALWYLPVLMLSGGLTTLLWDSWVVWRRRRRRLREAEALEANRPAMTQTGIVATSQSRNGSNNPTPLASPPRSNATTPLAPLNIHYTSPRVGSAMIAVFLAVFVVILVLRAVLDSPPVLYKMSSNLFLAGTIILGGGPVVIPLLNEYIVAEGWVSPRDFLLGVAIIQAFPGPNFNFAVFLAVLTPTGVPTPIAGLIGLLAIFTPGLVLAAGATAIWGSLRKNAYVRRALRGVNAAAVGLVWAAVVRLWNTGYLRVDNAAAAAGGGTTLAQARGASLGERSWWFVVATVAFCGNRWYGFPPPLSIVLGGIMGLVWAAAVYKL